MLLAKVGPISAFELCINPESFSQSVENLFFLSHLIKDKKVVLEPNEEGDDLIVG